MTERKPKLSRQDFLRVMGVVTSQLFLFGAGGMTYSTAVEPAWVEIKQVKLSLSRLGKMFAGFRIVQISDIHMGGWMNAARFENVLRLALNESPDVLVFTGDFVESTGRKKEMRAAVQDLNEVLQMADHLPRLAVLGNHDLKYYSDFVRDMLAERNVPNLTNTVYVIERAGARLCFAGIDDLREGKPDLKKVLNELPADGATILLSHEPDFADESAATGRFDLQLSGHSHGGQVVFPFIGPLLLPEGGRKYYDGLYQVGNMLQYTTRGVGMTNPFVRFNCRPELTVITLQSGA